MIKWIIFDTMGVIFRNRNIFERYLLPFLKKRGIKKSREEIKDTYLSATLGEITLKEFWERLELVNRYPLIEEEYLSKFEIDGDFYNVVSNLKNQFHLALISNDIKEWSQFLRKKYKIEDLFDVIIISSEVGIRKPNYKIFMKLKEKLNTIPQECIFVDDSLENLQSVADLGFRTIRFIRENDKINFCSEFEVSSFTQLNFVIQNYF